MKYVDEFREPEKIKTIIHSIQKISSRRWKIMEVCGGQTHSIMKYGIDQLLANEVELLHGPGCPVCVTPSEILDQAFSLAKKENVILCTYGDMMRVPGSDGVDLFQVRAQGGDIRMVYSPLDALTLAEENPDRDIVFLAVGFETTAPVHALAIELAEQKKVQNFYMLISHVLVPPAVEMILNSKDSNVEGFLAAGHVCTIVGDHEYHILAQKYKVPFVITGFEPLDIFEGLYFCIKQLESKQAFVENQYSRSVRKNGNTRALDSVKRVFEISNQLWRGLGQIPSSGLSFRPEFEKYDALKKFSMIKIMTTSNSTKCLSGTVLKGSIKPNQCPSFGKECTPESPLGPTMVSSEGACSAYYKYRRGPNES